jgi:hypothetical protein
MVALGGERSYSINESEWSASRPQLRFASGKGPLVPIVWEAGWASEPVQTERLEEKSFASARDRTLIARYSSL